MNNFGKIEHICQIFDKNHGQTFHMKKRNRTFQHLWCQTCNIPFCIRVGWGQKN